MDWRQAVSPAAARRRATRWTHPRKDIVGPQTLDRSPRNIERRRTFVDRSLEVIADRVRLDLARQFTADVQPERIDDLQAETVRRVAGAVLTERPAHQFHRAGTTGEDVVRGAGVGIEAGDTHGLVELVDHPDVDAVRLRLQRVSRERCRSVSRAREFRPSRDVWRRDPRPDERTRSRFVSAPPRAIDPSRSAAPNDVLTTAITASLRAGRLVSGAGCTAGRRSCCWRRSWRSGRAA